MNINTNRSRGVSMNRTPVTISIILSLFIVIGGASYAYRYMTKEFLPWQAENQVVIAASNTAQAVLETATASAVQANQTATASAVAVEQTATAEAIAANQAETALAISSNQTATAAYLPTATPDNLTKCDAVAKGGNLSPVPGASNPPKGLVAVPANSPVIVDGRLRDSYWVHVNFNGDSGFMATNLLDYKDRNCAPSVEDLSFWAGWLEPDRRVLVDDTFASNQYQWFRKNDDGSDIAILASGNTESTLAVSATGKEVVFSTDMLRLAAVPTFKLHTFVTFRKMYEGGSYLGIRFYDDNNTFYQIRFYPVQCKYSIYENENESFPQKLEESICRNPNYSLMVSVDTDHNINLNINGVDKLAQIPNLQGLNIAGGISFTAYKIDADFNYIVVTAPR